ncbi:MAG: Fic family protein [Candidatus Paceibacterota bacterium]
MSTLSQREKAIVSLVAQTPNLSASEIHDSLPSSIEDVSLVTVKRDLGSLTEQGYLERQGKGRAVTYSIAPEYRFNYPFDVESYFDLSADEREGKESFNFSIFEYDLSPFSAQEHKELDELNEQYKKNIASLSPTVIQKETERIIIELSWKSSHIEGNTYSLLETETLIKEHKEAEGHTKEEKVMILNHKEALDYIFSNPEQFQTISLRNIEDVHTILTKDLGISSGLRSSPVGVIGTTYRPPVNIHQIKEATEKMCEYINAKEDIFEKALLTTLLLAYIQPFEDGNKRTSRLMSNALLVGQESCPLSYRSVDEVEYKKAIILFYEQNNISYFKDIFVEQFTFAAQNYFQS